LAGPCHRYERKPTTREEALRSKTPRGVAQELWSLGLLYNLVRLEMEQIAAEAGLPPTRIHCRAAVDRHWG